MCSLDELFSVIGRWVRHMNREVFGKNPDPALFCVMV